MSFKKKERLRLSTLQMIKRFLLSVLIFILLGILQVVIWVVPFRVYANNLEKEFTIYNVNKNLKYANGYAWLIGRLVAKVARITPWPSKCLVQAMAVKFLLRRFGIANEMFIGVALDESQKLSAHAWVNVATFIVVGGANSVNEFKVIRVFRDTYVGK